MQLALVIASAFYIALSAINQVNANACISTMRGQSAYHPYSALSVATCSSLQLASLPLSVSPTTAVLLFDNNLLKYVHEDTLKRFIVLEQLDLSNNEIDTVSQFAFYSNMMLTDLNLANNKLERLHVGLFAQLVNLQRLNLSVNMLRVLQNDTFGRLRNLTVLDLSRNRIDTIEVGTFRNLHKLRELILVGNQLQTLPGGMEPMMPPELRTLKLGGNNWRCDCHLLWLKQYLLGSGSRAPIQYDKDAVICLYGTKGVQTKALQYIAFTQMVCAPELYAPKVPQVRKVAAPGSTVRFECSMFMIPKREVMWIKDGELVNTRTYFESSRFTVDTSPGNNFTAALSISRADYADAGTYSCTHGNEAGSVAGNFTLEVTRGAAGSIKTAPDGELAEEQSSVEGALKSWVAYGSTAFTVLVASAGACVAIFIVSTVVYCVCTSRHNSKVRRRQPKSKVKPESQPKYNQIGVNGNHLEMHFGMMPINDHIEGKFDTEADNETANLLHAAADYPPFSANTRTLCRVNDRLGLQATLCGNDVNGASPILPPPAYNLVCDDFTDQHFDSDIITPNAHQFATQLRKQRQGQGQQQQQQQQAEGHHCPVHGTKPAALVQPMTNGIMTLNADPHHVHQPSCPMFSVTLNPNASPYGTIRRQACPLHGCAAVADDMNFNLNQDDLASLPPPPPPHSQYNMQTSIEESIAMGATQSNVYQSADCDVANTYMKVSHVDDCIRENMDENSLRAFGSKIHDNVAKRSNLNPAIAGIEEEAENEAFSTVV